MGRVKTYLTVAFLLAQSLSSFSQQSDHGQWELISKNDGFYLYSRSNAISEMDEIRISFYVNSDLDRIAKIIHDVDNYENWVYKCKEATKRQIINENEFNFYLRTDFPFPLADRHMLVHCRQEIKRELGEYHSYSSLEKSPLNDEDDCEVMQYFESSWAVKEINPGYFKVIYQVLADPSNLPAWAVNLAITKGPLESMAKFRNMVSDMKNQNLTAVD